MKNIKIIVAIMLLVFSEHVWADGGLYWKGSVQALQRFFNGSVYYDSLTGLGIHVSKDYLEQTNFTFGYNYNGRQYKSGLTNAPNEMNENVVFFSASRNYFPDSLPGKLTLRLDGYLGRDEYNSFGVPASGSMGGGTRRVSVIDNFAVLSPIMAYINHAKTFYAGLGFSYSTYSSRDSKNYNINITHSKKNTVTGGSSTDDIEVMQWAPSLGFGFNRSADWLQLRSYLIDYSSSNRVDFIDSTAALEAKWIHWFSLGPILGLDSVSINLLFGERIYAVDGDSYSLYSLADVQKASIAMSAKWKLESQLDLVVQGGYESYEDVVDNNDYSSFYLFSQISKNW